uniref:Sulfatase domain-containing protein n=1 Tax=Steinernema glaseri TaxID=37863 RepID=A0A1I8AJC2_9BILA
MRNYQPLSVPRKTRFYALLLAVPLTFFVIFQQLSYSKSHELYNALLMRTELSENEACKLPNIDPWDETILPFFRKADPLNCKRLQPELTYLTPQGLILFNTTELQTAGYEITSLQCSYRCFGKELGGDDTLQYGSWTELENGTRPECEFVEVDCRKKFPPLSIYTNLHARVIPKKEIVDKNKRLPKRPNVILFVLDSVSEASWRRSLPKTLNVLLEGYKSTVFRGFNKVADNSFPNAVAFLTGKRVMTPGHSSELPDDMSKSYFDDWPLIWNDYTKEGYATFYAEDLIKYNLFYYLSNGFKGKPVNHYFRPFWVRIYETFVYRRSTPMCFGNKPSHLVQMDYLKSLLNVYKEKAPVFALHWLTELGHDWSSQVALGDADIARFFEGLKEVLRESYVFVFSDHGHRFDQIRQTVVGRLEERLPFFSVHVPEGEMERNKELRGILQRNSKVS